MVPVPDQPLLLKWNDPIQRPLVRGRGRSIAYSLLVVKDNASAAVAVVSSEYLNCLVFRKILPKS